LDERVRRYLRLQIELGGSEVLVSRPMTQLGTQTGRRTDGQTEEVTRTGEVDRQTDRPLARRPVEPSADPSIRSSARPPSKDWRQGAPPIPGPGLSVEAPAIDLLSQGPSWSSLEEVAEKIGVCTKCFLCEGRTNTVPGEGSARAQMMLVGEGPGQVEDQTGRPFVGRAGELLTEILAAIGLPREEVFIANVVKCRPPQNRKPLPEEMAACFPYLERQIALIRPKVLVALGATAAEALLQTKRSLTDLRGKVHSYHGIPLVVTYHPAALLRNPNWKKPTWDDIRIARQLLDR